MKLVEIADQQRWDGFVSRLPYAQFLQSWAWGEFRVSRGSAVKRFFIQDDDRVRAAVMVEFRARRFSGYWYAPRGPVFAADATDDDKKHAFRALLEQLPQMPELRRRTLFWRFEPVVERGKPEGFIPLSMRRADALNPSTTIVVDLELEEETLLVRLHEKTRYNVRLAERKGVRTRVSTSDKDLDVFLKLLNETAERDRFVAHDAEYLRASFVALRDAGMGHLRLAEWEGKLLAASFVVTFGDTVTYLHGASSSEARNVMAPYILHWDMIRDARSRGAKLYDLWGANPPSKAMFDYKPSWEGITRFKLGWGGRTLILSGTWDLPRNVFAYRLAFMNHFFRG